MTSGSKSAAPSKVCGFTWLQSFALLYLMVSTTAWPATANAQPSLGKCDIPSIPEMPALPKDALPPEFPLDAGGFGPRVRQEPRLLKLENSDLNFLSYACVGEVGRRDRRIPVAYARQVRPESGYAATKIYRLDQPDITSISPPQNSNGYDLLDEDSALALLAYRGSDPSRTSYRMEFSDAKSGMTYGIALGALDLRLLIPSSSRLCFGMPLVIDVWGRSSDGARYFLLNLVPLVPNRSGSDVSCYRAPMDQLQAPASKYMTNNNSDWFVVLTDGNNYYISLTDGQGHEPFLSIPMDITAEQAARSGFLPTVSQVFDAWLAGDVTVRLKSIATAFQVEQQTAALERSKQEQVKLLTEGQRVIDEVLSTAATNRDAMSGPQVRPAGR